MIQSALIVGAGIGGLNAALSLVREGVDVSIFEAADHLGEVGAGIQLSPNAMHVLRDIGVDKAVKAAGFEPQFAGLRNWKSGAWMFCSPLGQACRKRYGAPYIHIHRADLHQILHQTALACGVDIHTSARIKRYESRASDITIQTPVGEFSGDILIGADGLKSAVRTQMLGPEAPRFTGQVAWRGMVRVDDLPKGLIEPGVTVWAGPDQHVVLYYLRGGSLVNFVAVQERDDWTDESWTQTGDLGDLRDAFKGWHPTVTQVLRAADQCHLWALFDRDPLPQWSDGRAVLLGDACHPTLPSMAQGACMAIEDGDVLRRALSQYELPQALAKYQTHRKPRTSALQARARENAQMFHLNGGPITAAKLAVARMLPTGLKLKPLDSVYGYRTSSFDD
jgi:salicylate hydroxylase